MFEPSIEPSKRAIGVAVFCAVLGLATLLSWVVISQIDTRPRTNDASVGAAMLLVSAGVPGRVATVDVSNDTKVSEGGLLFSLDDTTFRLLRDQAAAQLDAARAALAGAENATRATRRNATSAAEEITRAERNLELAEATVARLEPLAADGIASQQILDEARTAAADAQVSLNVARQTAAAANDLVGNTDALAAEVRAAEALLASAEHRLAQTKVIAPFTGYVTGLGVAEGSWVLPEQPALTLINSEKWHIEAYFRETDLAAISPGMPARVRVLSHAGIALDGSVSSVGRGVQGSDAIELGGLLPIIPRSTDWVRLAKRFPVRINLNGPIPDFMRLGASASVVIGVSE